ncbi:MAG: hypothetical protein A2284_16955 [Deltaproteobacteria bacterium RIFOXYA12_FULL_61_11]|nr:MAG: hypothetical protein A2284_16955 [Deltaproteobacteria bacterium RIFOXYA12_FULL_61_11]
MLDHLATLGALTPRSVLVIGDLMCDEYVQVSTERLSPEAPVPVLRYRDHHFNLGGAANVARNLRALEQRVSLLGVLGEDPSGHKVMELLEDLHIEAAGCLVDPTRPTTTKTRFISRRYQVLRLDRETETGLDPALADRLLELARERMQHVDGVVLSDYGKGVLSASLCQALIELARSHHKPILADPKGTDPRKYAGVDLLTPNRNEVGALLGRPLPDAPSLHTALLDLAELIGGAVLVTLGEQGVALQPKAGPLRSFPAEPREVYDVTGAGDTILAHAAVNLLNRVPLEELAFLANLAGGLAVTKFGAATVNLDEVRFELEHKHFISKKIKQLEELTGLVKEASAQGLRVIFTNGCFDMLHFGHIEFFRQARALGDLLVVATNSDRSIRAIKGQNRPHIRERQRLYLLASIDCIDHLILFDDETPLRLLEALRPQILVKAGHQDIVGAELVRGYGGQAFSLPLPGLEDREPTLTSIEDL